MTVEDVKQIIRNEIAGQQGYADVTAPNAGLSTPREHQHTAGVLCVMLRLIEFCESRDVVAAQASPPTPELPRRDVPALVEALRIRALALTGEKWERNATRDMMKEAADMLERLIAASSLSDTGETPT